MRALSFVVGAFFFWFTSSALAQDNDENQRIALVVSVGDYNLDGDLNDDRDSDAVVKFGYASDLPNTINDGADIKSALQSIDFEVVGIHNPTRSQLKQELFEFEQRVINAGPNTIAIVYFAGHAVQVSGANYLVPSGAVVPRVDLNRMLEAQIEDTLSDEFVPLNFLLKRLQKPQGSGMNIVILDSCRENPWDSRSVVRSVTGLSRGRGLAEEKIDLNRTAIAYATKPGDIASDGTGRNSPYTAALKQRIVEPGHNVRDLFSMVARDVEISTKGIQSPYINSPYMGENCIASCEADTNDESAELSNLLDAFDKGTREAMQSFLEGNPLSQYRTYAEQRISELEVLEEATAIPTETSRMNRSVNEIESGGLIASLAGQSCGTVDSSNQSGSFACRVSEGGPGPQLKYKNLGEPVWVYTIAVNPSGSIVRLGMPEELGKNRQLESPRLGVRAISGREEKTVIRVFKSESLLDIDVISNLIRGLNKEMCEHLYDSIVYTDCLLSLPEWEDFSKEGGLSLVTDLALSVAPSQDVAASNQTSGNETSTYRLSGAKLTKQTEMRIEEVEIEGSCGVELVIQESPNHKGWCSTAFENGVCKIKAHWRGPNDGSNGMPNENKDAPFFSLRESRLMAGGQHISCLIDAVQ